MVKTKMIIITNSKAPLDDNEYYEIIGFLNNTGDKDFFASVIPVSNLVCEYSLSITILKEYPKEIEGLCEKFIQLLNSKNYQTVVEDTVIYCRGEIPRVYKGL